MSAKRVPRTVREQLNAILRSQPDTVAETPGFEELWAFHQGQLEGEERDRVQAMVAGSAGLRALLADWTKLQDSEASTRRALWRRLLWNPIPAYAAAVAAVLLFLLARPDDPNVRQIDRFELRALPVDDGLRGRQLDPVELIPAEELLLITVWLPAEAAPAEGVSYRLEMTGATTLDLPLDPPKRSDGFWSLNLALKAADLGSGNSTIEVIRRNPQGEARRYRVNVNVLR